MALNESELIEKEITLRNLRLPKDVLETKRSIVRWLALSLGVLNPGESRLSSLAVFDSLLYFQFTKKSEPSVTELVEYINKNWEEINEKTLRYHLLRMKKSGLVENSQGKFYLKPPAIGDKFDPETWAKSVFESDYNEISSKVGEAIKELRNKTIEA
jgi:DNA-binding transcriptional ArsR family regulator